MRLTAFALAALAALAGVSAADPKPAAPPAPAADAAAPNLIYALTTKTATFHPEKV